MKSDFKRLPEYTDQAMLSEIARVAAIVRSETLTVAVFREHSRVGISTLRRRFGGWSRALEAAGLSHLYNRPAPAQKSRVLGRSLSNDDMLAEIRSIAMIAVAFQR